MTVYGISEIEPTFDHPENGFWQLPNGRLYRSFGEARAKLYNLANKIAKDINGWVDIMDDDETNRWVMIAVCNEDNPNGYCRLFVNWYEL